MTLHIYLPQDRLRAIANNTALPDRTSGSALFADISGFTLLTESLQNAYGVRRGSEELSKHLEEVYSALITEIERFGGSVIMFAGDAMLCWFDDALGSTASRAANSALAMQRTMRDFEAIHVGDDSVALTLKVTIATGPARRFVVGDPEILKIDSIAGATITRTSTAEHHAQNGEVLLDETSVNALGDSLTVQDWRSDEQTNERFAVVTQFNGTDASPSLPGTLQMPPPDKLMPWLHYMVFEREQYGGAFLTEFRPCVALFVRFIGIDYDADAAEKRLDAFIRQVQKIVKRYEGVLLQLTIGDKGSYAYINFGALNAHEDDSRRAVKTALELRNKIDLQLQIGITQGMLRTGAYGGVTRKVFGALGDDVNLAARLMMMAREGEILISGRVHKAVRDEFIFEPRPPIPVKGKTEPLPVFVVTGERRTRAIRLQEPNYALPMVGRQSELQIIKDKLDLAAGGRGQIIGIVAEAGLGKSRMVAEVIRSARRKGFTGFGGTCQSDGINTPYLAWKSIWQAFFDVDPEMPKRKSIRWLESEVEDRAPSRVDAMPLLNVVLDLDIPENDFTRQLEPKVRQSALHALFEDCLKAQARDEPTLIVIEDLQWIDALSLDLLKELANTLANHAVCFVLAYRPPLDMHPQITRIELHELTRAEAESAIRAKLAQLYPARRAALPVGLVDALMARTQGNPFYLEEMLNYVRDRGLDPSDIENIELPDSLHTLILSRIDQLSEQEKTTLRVASIIGRLFRAKWLTGYYPQLGSFPQVKTTLDALETLDITSQDANESELAYLFKHIVSHEVTYKSLAFTTRARLHEQLAGYLEKVNAPVDTIAFHYGHSENLEKKREYLRKAGEAAQKSFANDAALQYYGMLLPLLKYAKEQAHIHLKRGQVLEFIGRSDDAETNYRAALELARNDLGLKASVQLALGKLYRLRGDYDPANEWLGKAKEAYAAVEDTAGLAQALIEIGNILLRQSEYTGAHDLLNEGLNLARRAGDKLNMAKALNSLGIVSDLQGEYSLARRLYKESLALRREMGDKTGISSSLNNLGGVALAQGDTTTARALYEECLAHDREVGDKWGIEASLINLGILALGQGDTIAARALYEECLAIGREMGDNIGQAYSLLGLGLTDLAEDKPESREHILDSLRLRQETGEQLVQTSSLIGAAGLALHERNLEFAAQLLGAVESTLKTLNAEMEPEMKDFHKQTLVALREQLGEAKFQSSWEQGSQWSLEEAVRKALEDRHE